MIMARISKEWLRWYNPIVLYVDILFCLVSIYVLNTNLNYKKAKSCIFNIKNGITRNNFIFSDQINYFDGPKV